MEADRICAVLDYYDKRLAVAGVLAVQYPDYLENVAVAAATLEHLRYMIPELRKLLDEGRVEKAMRWYGFIQGVLWALGVFSLDELKDHSRPDMPVPVVREE